ncbi:MAG: sulfite exporter TauE/SafE family protein [Xanthobacteraceae bacterium]|nr:sulfite exporter TauE/SafE family protein [Xanthobacteraceae bacterium]
MHVEFTPALLAFVATVFLLAGFVKGMIGMGLPTVAIGLLATRIPTLDAIAITIVPAIVTNIWQTFVGPYLKDIMRRLWPLFVCTCIGVWFGAGLLTGAFGPYATVLLGLLLIVYATLALTKVRFSVKPQNEKWIGGLCGFLSGLIAAATGIQVFPGMPFLQALNMERNELIQALGVFFTVATVAMMFNLTHSGILTAAVAVPGALAMATAFAGMYLGQVLRERMAPETFRHWFLISMIVLGAYLAIDKLIRLHLI